MRRLNRSRAEIEHYFNSPQYRNEQDYIRGRVNYVGGRELWRERAARCRRKRNYSKYTTNRTCHASTTIMVRVEEAVADSEVEGLMDVAAVDPKDIELSHKNITETMEI